MLIESRPQFQWFAITCLLAGVAMIVAAAVTHDLAWCIGGIGPLVIGLTLLSVRPVMFRMELTPQGLLVDERATVIPFDEIQSVTMATLPQDPRRPLREGPIAIVHRSGAFEIPCPCSVNASQLYRDLLRNIPLVGRGVLSPQLQELRDQQVAIFGPGLVWSYARRSIVGSKPTPSKGFRVLLAMGLVGPFWIIAPTILLGHFHAANSTLQGWGGIFTAIGLFGSLILWSVRRARERLLISKPGDGLVISPQGIWLMQGDLEGHLKWEEILAVNLNQQRRSFQYSNETGVGTLVISVAHAVIPIRNIFDRPLPIIAEVIAKQWRPRG